MEGMKTLEDSMKGSMMIDSMEDSWMGSLRDSVK